MAVTEDITRPQDRRSFVCWKCRSVVSPRWAKKQWGHEAARIITMLDARWTPWLGWLETQLGQER
ncbi:uncharacterized protein BT62DRAFT_1014392 [Guyanagaster necrorhizus]|uniref:Uncharacterized protein n=1 Tax=Guyanagaster necrorhizus TaxID=856835 RepID=A0A9P7VF98_9AGAR|nr:uncharacterized protein BT62DRAFT_1014392 [Guyanagaster necrorhizus MCA 3950]KAG7439091.1 hypothetical protein BT62DRAFT_1014392 [Guyanagaster necrorhizus MCA 3950]